MCSRGLHIVGVCLQPVANPCLQVVLGKHLQVMGKHLQVVGKLKLFRQSTGLESYFCQLQEKTMLLVQNDGIRRTRSNI